tara:strand:+ start:711 stop:1070 length:360 start_codon:yes stop_codon:yes gene_type:complete
MGLDMYLYRLRDGQDRDDSDEIVYWRKANAIHGYFTEGAEEDNCVDFPVTVDQLEYLVETCAESIMNKEPLLRPYEGMFFGSNFVDDWYWNSIKETLEDLSKVLNDHKEGDEYVYSAWY